MAEWSASRLMVVGPKRTVKQFQQNRWARTLKVSHVEELEWSNGMFICLFETSHAPVEKLRVLSLQWQRLTFLLDYHVNGERLKGLARVKAGRVDECQFHY